VHFCIRDVFHLIVLNFLVDLNPKNELHALFFTFFNLWEETNIVPEEFSNDVIFENPQQQNQHLVNHAIASLGVTRELNLGKKYAHTKSAASVSNVLTVQRHQKFHARHTMIVVEKRHFATMACAIRVINVKIVMTESMEPVVLAEQLHLEIHAVPQLHLKVHARHTMTAEEIRHFATMACAIPAINVNIALTELTIPVALAVPPRMGTLAIRVRPGAGEMDKTG